MVQEKKNKRSFVAAQKKSQVLRLFANVSIDDIQFDIQFSLNERYGWAPNDLFIYF